MLVSAKFFEEAYVMGTQGMWGRDRGPDGRGEGEKKKCLVQLRRRGRDQKSWIEGQDNERLSRRWESTGENQEHEGFCFPVGSIFWFLDVG